MPAAKPPLPSLCEQLMAAASHAAMHPEDARRTWPVNPFPCGVQKGSVTDRVLKELLRIHPRTLNHGQLMDRCNAGRGAVSWAVRYLQEQELIESLQDLRQSTYLRYRAIVKE